jgi:hypothetical protein
MANRLKDIHDDYVAVQVYGNGLMRDMSRELYTLLIDYVHAAAGGATSDELHERIPAIEFRCDGFMLAARYDLNVPGLLDEEGVEQRDAKRLWLTKRARVESRFKLELQQISDRVEAHARSRSTKTDGSPTRESGGHMPAPPQSGQA